MRKKSICIIISRNHMKELSPSFIIDLGDVYMFVYSI